MRLNDWLSLTDAVMVCYGLFFFPLFLDDRDWVYFSLSLWHEHGGRLGVSPTPYRFNHSTSFSINTK